MPLIYSILFNNKSFSFITSRYRTTCRSCLRMATDRPDCLGQRIPRASLWRGCSPRRCSGVHPAGQRSTQRASQPCLHLEVSSSGKGRGNDVGAYAIKVDLDSLREFLVLLPEENRPISGGLRKDLVDTLLVACGSVVIVTVLANTLHFRPFQSFPPSISLLYTPALDQGIYHMPANLKWPFKELEMSLQKAINSSNEHTCFKEVTPAFCLFFFPFCSYVLV